MRSLPRPSHRRHVARHQGLAPVVRARRPSPVGSGLDDPSQAGLPAATAAWSSHADALLSQWHSVSEHDTGRVLALSGQLGQVIRAVRAFDPALADKIAARMDDRHPADAVAWYGALTSAAEPVVELADVEPDPEPTLDLPAWIDHQAGRYQALGTLAGELVGRTLDDLARLVRFVGAADPGVARDRLDALDAMARMN